MKWQWFVWSICLACINLTSAYAKDVIRAQGLGARGVYIGGSLGYAWRDWEGSDLSSMSDAPDTFQLFDNTSGAFASILDVGYQWSRYFSLEGGWVYWIAPNYEFQNMNRWYSTTGTDSHTYALFLGFRGLVFVRDTLALYGSVSWAYNENDLEATDDLQDTIKVSTQYWSPMFAVGLQQALSRRISMQIQYAYLPGSASGLAIKGGGHDFEVPPTSMLTFGFAYTFLM